MRVDEFDFHLPEDLIALAPARPRDSAGMLVVQPSRQEKFVDAGVADLPGWLRAGDVLVLNDTRVIRAELHGMRHRLESEARIEATLTRRLDDSRWLALARPAKRLRVGDAIAFGGPDRACALNALEASVEAKGEAGEIVLAFSLSGPYLDDAIRELGSVPLPPYISGRRPAADSDAADYQTVFARAEGAVAAPTAGLHFTPQLLDRIRAAGVGIEFITLHVGPGTFLPVKAEDTAGHVMQAEWGEVAQATAKALNDARDRGGRIVAGGTTALRLLESAAEEGGRIQPFKGETSIFITPGYRFRAADLLLTNFHLPRSTLFMLAAAFSGLGLMHEAYAHAIRRRYRFYSFGDACLLHPEVPRG
ncbi:MAG: tRNA preQ1(34) S-adenosylmethionine ribosyltransferase-isomerase QueA [Hyphomicrobiaceae bacterium]|nr:MAG: tRNA preQ1(34) S-adenosylmethionine ribosyltransferase-isomerase QueA [Hyphomicrobiaceae bacterium]